MCVNDWGSFGFERLGFSFFSLFPRCQFVKFTKISGSLSGSGPENYSSGSASGRPPHNWCFREPFWVSSLVVGNFWGSVRRVALAALSRRLSVVGV